MGFLDSSTGHVHSVAGRSVDKERAMRCGVVALTLAVLAGLVRPPAAAADDLRRLAFVEAHFHRLNGTVGIGSAQIVSPDGNHVYTVGQNALATWQRDASGALTLVDVQRDGESGVDGLAGTTAIRISPDGGHVYVAGYGDNAVAVFSRNATSGVLTFVEVQRNGVGGVDGLAGASALVLSPDAQHVYVAGSSDNAVAVFNRNTSTGALTFVEVQKDGVGGVDGLFTANTVAVSSDGAHVYAAGYNDQAVAVFSRNTTTGALTFVEVQRNGVGGVQGLLGVSAIAVSPDGGHMYAAGNTSSAIAVFARNATTGSLTFVEVQTNGGGLSEPVAVEVSPDGTLVYAVGGISYNSYLVVFARNATTGALTFAEVAQYGVGGVWGMDGPLMVTPSDDGKHVYVAGSNGESLAVFRTILCGNGVVDTNELCDDGGLTEGDGCDSNCLPTACGNGVVSPGEQCDDGNLVDDDACRPDCLGQPDAGLVTRLTTTPGAVGPPAISADGRFVAFLADTTPVFQAFVIDRTTGATEQISVSSGGTAANAMSYGFAVSADGRFVAFNSFASNLVAGDTNGVEDVFVRDTQTDTTERVSVDDIGTQGDGPSGQGQIGLSADGRFVAFRTRASNLASGDPHGVGLAVLVHDRQDGSNERVALDALGAEVGSYDPAISADGRYVAFVASDTLIPGGTNSAADLYVRDRQTGGVERVSKSSTGDEANDQSSRPAISADGRYVAFTAIATNLVADDTNGFPDVFVHDRDTGTTERVSVTSDGTESNYGALASAISDDGRYVTFDSYANNLVPGDMNGAGDYFLRDRVDGTTVRVTLDSAGLQAVGDQFGGYTAPLSGDGRFVAFYTESAYAPGDVAGSPDIYVRDRGIRTNAAASESVTTDWAGDGATPQSPLEVTVTTPNAGSVSLAESTASVPIGFAAIGVQAQITAPAATSATPLVLVFTIDASVVPAGEDETSIEFFKDAVLVPPCSGAPSTASPDPCVSSRVLLPGNDVEITILTSSLSVWAAAVRLPLPPSTSIGAKKLLIKDDPNPSRRKIVFLSKDAAIDTTNPAGIDPASEGAFLHVYNSATGDSACFVLPAPFWTAKGRLPSPSFKYSDKNFANGACKTVMIKDGKLLQATCQAKTQPITYSLNEPTQGSVAVMFGSGDTRYCTVLGGTVQKDSATSRQFSAKDAAAPASCPAPPAACP